MFVLKDPYGQYVTRFGRAGLASTSANIDEALRYTSISGLISSLRENPGVHLTVQVAFDIVQVKQAGLQEVGTLGR